MILNPYIPQQITVHLGAPDSAAANVTLAFPDYIKNVASSEIYPTWPENALRANIYAIVSFALNRIYTDWYPSQGYNFDITSSTRYDQSFVNGRDYFNNISMIVDELFNDYVRRQNSVEPYFTQYCNGTTVFCSGLSQWGTVSLANQGLTPYEILQYYYGDNINIVSDAPVRVNMPSYPGMPLSLGMINNSVRAIQIRLNRIRENYPSIPTIPIADSIYGVETERAVRAFQKSFSLPQTGVTDKGTWYQIAYIFTAVKRLSDLNSEGISTFEAEQRFPEVLRAGDSGIEVRVAQSYINTIGTYDDDIPPIAVDGVFGSATENAVRAIQQKYGLTVDGVIGRNTWNAIQNAYTDIVDNFPPDETGQTPAIFPGTFLREGFEGVYVRLLQIYLNALANVYSSIPTVPVTGYFGSQTNAQVIAFQNLFGYTPDGLVGPIIWDNIIQLYEDEVLYG